MKSGENAIGVSPQSMEMGLAQPSSYIYSVKSLMRLRERVALSCQSNHSHGVSDVCSSIHMRYDFGTFTLSGFPVSESCPVTTSWSL